MGHGEAGVESGYLSSLTSAKRPEEIITVCDEDPCEVAASSLMDG